MFPSCIFRGTNSKFAVLLTNKFFQTADYTHSALNRENASCSKATVPHAVIASRHFFLRKEEPRRPTPLDLSTKGALHRTVPSVVA